MPHIHELIDFTASVFVVNKDAVLLRMHEKYNKWLSVGGHVELDEDPNQAAIREAKEESGLDIVLHGSAPLVTKEADNFKSLVNSVYMNIHQVKLGSTHKHCDFIYFATTKTRELAPRKEEKSCEMRWFTKNELDDPSLEIYPSTRYYAKAALDVLGVRTV